MHALPLLRPTTAAAFCLHHFTPGTPCLFPRSHFASLPAVTTWFTASGALNLAFFRAALSAAELSAPVTVESSTRGSFERINMPLEMLLHFLSYEEAPPGLPDLYLAQTAVPAGLQASVPMPEVVGTAGNGDVYAVNLWLGRCETIDTPLHKDPNPNVFVQVGGRKRVRMFAPRVGEALIGGKVARFRTEEEMMMGDGRKRVEEAVWGEGEKEGYEVNVGPGDGVFIPQGWWHAVKGIGEGVGGSVNWWFR